MALSAFDDKTREPTNKEVVAFLGDTGDLWTELSTRIASEFDPLAEEWVFPGKKWGWSKRLKHKKRAVLYMTPTEGCFYVGFSLGKKAVDAAHHSDLRPAVLEIIDSAEKFVEGRGVRLEVRSLYGVEDAVGLAKIKMAN